MGCSAATFILVALFGSSSWMGTNSVWMQLPLLTSELPEQWNLPSYLAGVVQIACIVPLIYTILHKGVKSFTIPTAPLIIALLSLACCCQLGLSFFWSDYSEIFGAPRSWPLYSLLFGLAIVNAMSNVLFMPFMAQFHPAYLNAYFVGMGLSSLAPSLLSLAQGTSMFKCDEKGVAERFPPNFSVSIFFFVIFSFTCVALFAFIALYRSGAHTHFATPNKKEPNEGTPLKKDLNNTSSSRKGDDEDESPIEIHETGAPAIDAIVSELDVTFRERSAMINDDSEPHPVDYITGVKFTFLLFTTALVNAQMNGIITSVQSYAALPYSQATYHFAVTLSNVVSPLSSFLPFFISVRSIPVLAILTACSTAMTAFIVYLAALSPNLIFNSVTIGSALSIGGSLIAAGLHSYLRVVFASLLREGHQSESRLFWCGVFIQIGSFIGSAVMFPLVNIAHLFTSAPQCKSIS
ncbi:Riboflavin transporter rft-2 [Caenorhabditis elegans]|uniref:Isoform a of Riboflavin transporter rft-2 n=2 Tax=Caenorhabditis elegans TaxID=6239 RepID=G4SDH4-2|nr:Riboflavin transporter rft-2 [Caenorhabditis elegans]AFZ75250.1 riboflavin transporter [Caenorhabditis elegans]CCD69388.1 Riboflavin transporter rft-2 [Caenorhabditis elegans]|eukprot:NP_001256040.1 Riboflavin transporter rft-2 [Caenorhabditis elegans]